MKRYTITFPHAGDYYLAFEYLFRSLGYEVLVPPKSSRKSFDLGIKHAPAQACLPFKMTLGNLIQGLARGANIVGMIGGKTGMCRLAYYSQLYKKVLFDMGYSFELFNIKIKKEMWDTVKKHFPETEFPSFLKSIYGFWLKLRLIEVLREQCLVNRPYEKVLGRCSELNKLFVSQIAKINKINELRQLKNVILDGFKEIDKDMDRNVIRIGLVGEFFLLIDQFSTLDFEIFLGNLGVVIKPSLSFSEFFVGSIKQVRFFDKFFPSHRNRVAKLAKPFMDRPIGGHGMQSLGQTARYAELGFDGVIHLYPFTCMPEIVASSILPQVSSQYNIPVLSLCLDEQTGFAGLQTRLEAFVDMIRRKKNNVIAKS